MPLPYVCIHGQIIEELVQQDKTGQRVLVGSGEDAEHWSQEGQGDERILNLP